MIVCLIAFHTSPFSPPGRRLTTSSSLPLSYLHPSIPLQSAVTSFSHHCLSLTTVPAARPLPSPAVLPPAARSFPVLHAAAFPFHSSAGYGAPRQFRRGVWQGGALRYRASARGALGCARAVCAVRCARARIALGDVQLHTYDKR